MRSVSSIVFPEDFKIIIDTREKCPVIADTQYNVPMVRKTLRYGDYSVQGLERFIAIERKSTGDFLTCLGKRRKNFNAQIGRLQEHVKRPFLLVENSLLSILHPQQHGSQMSPESVWGSILALQTRTNIPIMFFSKHWLATRWVIEVLLSAWHSYHKGYK